MSDAPSTIAILFISPVPSPPFEEEANMALAEMFAGLAASIPAGTSIPVAVTNDFKWARLPEVMTFLHVAIIYYFFISY